MEVQNKGSKPNNIVASQSRLKDECVGLERELPDFLYDYFLYLRSSVATSTRHAYLLELRFFLNYLVMETSLTNAEEIKKISLEELRSLSAKDINRFLSGYCSHYEKYLDGRRIVIENDNKSLSRKKSALAVMFKFLYRDGSLDYDISGGFNPIKIPKKQSDAIKRLEIEEVNLMMEAVSTGAGLAESELRFWEKTKYRDRAILLLFTTYGLRLKELWQLNVSSFDFDKEEFTVYRKRDKQVRMPINKSAKKVLQDYLELERPGDEELDEENRDALFLSLRKKRITEKAIRNLVKKYTSIALKSSRRQGYSPHKLRATTASTLIEYGFSIFDVQNLMDHDHVTTTQLYAQHRKYAKKEILDDYELLDERERKESESR